MLALLNNIARHGIYNYMIHQGINIISFIQYYKMNSFTQIENGRSKDKRTLLFEEVEKN
jgi:hypothetical protein